MIKILTILFLLSANVALAQTPYLYFNRITTANGLSHNKVNCILQDKRGFLWLGTDDGLNRFDGQSFTIFRHEPHNPSTLSGNIITGLLEDKDGIIWITTTDGGLSKYDYRLPVKQQFKNYKHVEGDSTSIPINVINGLLEDKYGYLWLATGGASLLRFDKKTHTFQMPVSKGTKTILAMCLDDNGILWAGRQGGSFLKVNTATLAYETDERYNNLYAKLPHASITALYKDEENNIWFGSWDNVLYRHNARTGKEDVFKKDQSLFSFPDDEVQSFARDSYGRIWMGGRYYGLTLYDKNAKRFYNYRYNVSQEGTIADNHINCVYIDRSGLVWLATNKGVNTYNPSQQPFAQTFLPHTDKDITIYDFTKDEKNVLWIATNVGLFSKNGESGFKLNVITYQGEQLAVTKLYRDQGNFYVGTNYSLFLYEPQTNNISLLANTDKDLVMKKIISSRIVSIIKDTIEGHPVLLVSPYGHYIAYYDFTERRWISRTDSSKNIVSRYNLKDNLVRKFFRSGNGDLWLATAKSGFAKLLSKNKPTLKYYSNNPSSETSISNDNVYDITEDATGNLWVSTYGGGLNYFNTSSQKISHISASNNLLEGIQTDDAGNVWMISNGHLHKYNPMRKTYSSFAIPDIEKSGGVRGNIVKDNEGNMYAAGTNYFIKFNPALVRDTTIQPQVYFTDFKIFNTSYAELLSKKSIKLLYNQNYFTIEFAAPQFTGNPVEYYYMLQGIDDQWVSAGGRNFANYSNLQGGTYTFKVRATNKKGYYGDNIIMLNLTIVPPFWQRWWFYALCAVVISSVIYAIYRYRLNEVLKREAIRNRIAQDLHDNLGSTLSSISVYSQVAKIYQSQQKEEQLEQTLEKIGETSGEMVSEMSDIVWAINPKNDHMSTIIQRMESYARPLLQTQNIGFYFKYDPSVPALNLHMEKRKNFYLIFKEAINNSLKYANCRNIHVTIIHHHHHVALTVADDGAGFDIARTQSTASKSLSGNGLKNMKMRAAEYKGKFVLNSFPGKGTTVFVEFSIP